MSPSGTLAATPGSGAVTQPPPSPSTGTTSPNPSYGVIKQFNAGLDQRVPKEDFRPNVKNQPGQEYPQVNSEGYARFRVVAPDAKSVIVSLGLGGRGGTVLRKDKDGVWTGTTEGPMDEGFHYYHPDHRRRRVQRPRHPQLRLAPAVGRKRHRDSRPRPGLLCLAQGRGPRPHPAGGLLVEESTGRMQTAMVYLPPQYGKVVRASRSAIPCSTCSTAGARTRPAGAVQGHAGIIMDNLLAEGKAKPFIIVMAYGLTNDFKFGSIGKFTAEEFEKLLIDELMPVVDKEFLTKPDKNNRALAGLSMGGIGDQAHHLRRPRCSATGDCSAVVSMHLRKSRTRRL